MIGQAYITCYILQAGVKKGEWLKGKQTAKHCTHMCLWTKGATTWGPPGLAEVGGNFHWSFSVTLPFAHQAKCRGGERRNCKVLLISSLEYFLMLVILSPHAHFVAKVLFLRTFGTETFT